MLVDDQPVVAGGLTSLFREQAFELIAHATTPEEIRPLVVQHQPAVVVSESRLHGVDVLDQLADILLLRTAPAVVVFSSQDDLTHVARAAAIGVFEYVPKCAPLELLADAMKLACRKAAPRENGLIAQTRSRMRRPRQMVRDDVPLTRRELQVLQHIAMGLSNREIGSSLDISVETAKEHVQNILRKLNVNDRTQAAVWAVRKELV